MPRDRLRLAPTPAAWVEVARRDLGALLADHAHCERKAAGQAMALVAAHPGHGWLVAPMLALAREELAHLAQVLDELRRLGRPWTADPGDPYVRALHAAAVGGVSCPSRRLAARLVVAALVETRSCERFEQLGAALGPGSRLGRMWSRLAAQEAAHGALFLRLAEQAAGDASWLGPYVAAQVAAEERINAQHTSAARIH